MDKIKNVAVSSKKFCIRHKTGIVITTTAVICMALNRAALQAHDNFLKEHDLYEKFYNPEG